jgi:Fur family transcriptional regulator, ferric uptake regulator
VETNKSIPWPDGLKRSKPRIAVFDALEKETVPVTASALFEKIRSDDASVWLSSVYRALESFVEKGAVIKYIPTDSTMAMYELNRHTHKHYAVCVGCHAMLPVDDCPLHEMADALSPKCFHVTGHNLEIYGYCDKCFKKKDTK